MKTTVICGMLGSGKTTFIKKFAADISGRSVVLVNDFGKAGIDGEIFSAGGIESVELPSGCVCCTLKFDLITTIRKIVDTFAPDNLLIEPSGVASPSGVLDALDVMNIRNVTVIGIVDASEFLELHEADMFGRFFEDQITQSDIILVNKADLADGLIVERTVNTVEGMNPYAIVYKTVNCVIDKMLPIIPVKDKSINRHAPHMNFDSISIKPEDALDLDAVSSLFHDMSAGRYGEIVRAKALLNTVQGPYKFDLSFSNVRAVPFEKKVNGSRLVVIGKDLKKEELLSAI